MRNIFVKSAIVATVLGLGTTFVASTTSNVYSTNEQSATIETDYDFTNTEYGMDEVDVFSFEYGTDSYTPVETVRLTGPNSDYLFTHGRHTWKLLDLEGKVVNEGNFDSFEDTQQYKDWVADQADPSTGSWANNATIHNYVVNYGFNTVTPMLDGNLFMGGSLITDNAEAWGGGLLVVAIFDPINGEFVDYHVSNGIKSVPYLYEDTVDSGIQAYEDNSGAGYTDTTTTNGVDFMAVGGKSFAGHYSIDYGLENDPTDDTIVPYYHHNDGEDELISTQMNWYLKGVGAASNSIVRLDDTHTVMLYNAKPRSDHHVQENGGLVLISPKFTWFNNQYAENAVNPWKSQHWFYFDQLFPGEWTDSSNFSPDSNDKIGLGIATKLVELPTDQTAVLGQHGEWMIINNSSIIEYFDGVRTADQAAVKGVDYWAGTFNSNEKEEQKLTDAIVVNENKNIIFINEAGEWFLTDITGNLINQGYFGKYDDSVEEFENKTYYGYSSIIDLGPNEEDPYNFYVSGATTSKVVSISEDGKVNNVDNRINYEETYTSLVENNEFILGETTYTDIENALWDSLVFDDVNSHDEWLNLTANKDNANFAFYKDESTVIFEEDELVTSKDVNFKLVSNNKQEGISGSTDLITIEGLLESEVVEPEVYNLKFSNISQTSATLTYDVILPEGFEFSYSKIVSSTGEELYLGTNPGTITINDLLPNTVYSPSDSGIKLEITLIDGEGSSVVLTEEIPEFITLRITPTPEGRLVVEDPIIETDGTATMKGNIQINDDLGLFNPETSNPLLEVDRTRDGVNYETTRLDVKIYSSVRETGSYTIEVNGIDRSYTYSGAKLSLTGDADDFVNLDVVDEYGNEVIERVTPYIPEESGTEWYWWLIVVIIIGLVLMVPVEAWFITQHILMKKIADKNPNHGCVESHIRIKHGLRQEDRVITITQIIEHDDKDTLDIKGVIDFPKKHNVEAEDIKVKVGDKTFEIQLEAYHAFPNHFIFEIDGISRKADYTEIHVSTDGTKYYDFEVNTSLLDKNKHVTDEDDSDLKDVEESKKSNKEVSK